MGKETKITWTDASFNAWWGCTKVSPGCAHCYAETMAKRTGHNIWGPGTKRRFFGDKHWDEPLAWNAEAKKLGVRKRVFCSSMADVYEDAEGLDEQRTRLFHLIEDTPDLDWLLLTKRPENVNAMTPWGWGKKREGFGGWPENVWIGTSIESQQQAHDRLPHLAQIPARVKFVSAEPLIGPLTLGLNGIAPKSWGFGYVPVGELIDWVIVGGESGAGARPMDEQWARELKKECREAGVAFFMKQFGSASALGWGKRDVLEDFPEDLRIQEWPTKGRHLCASCGSNDKAPGLRYCTDCDKPA